MELAQDGRSRLSGRGRHTDTYSPFRWFTARARNRKRYGPSNLTVEYLVELWASQKGICPFTGWPMVLPHSTWGWSTSRAGYAPHNASLDRIDHKLGYVRGNVRFISLMANLARSTFSDEEVVEFCQAVAARGRVG